MTELNLTPMGDNGSYFYSTVVLTGTTYLDASIYVDLYDTGKIWLEISHDNISWYRLNGCTTNELKNGLIPLKNFNSSLLYRVCSSQKINTLKLIS